jgi:hypothetical protein
MAAAHVVLQQETHDPELPGNIRRWASMLAEADLDVVRKPDGNFLMIMKTLWLDPGACAAARTP